MIVPGAVEDCKVLPTAERVRVLRENVFRVEIFAPPGVKLFHGLCLRSSVSVFILFPFLRRFRQNYLYLLPEPTIRIYNKV